MTLSDKRFNSILMNDGSIPIFRNPRHLYDEKNVKKFIKEAFELAEGALSGGVDRDAWIKSWNKIFGDELI